MKKLTSLTTVLNPDDSTYVSLIYIDEDGLTQRQELSNDETKALLTAIGKVLTDFTIVK